MYSGGLLGTFVISVFNNKEAETSFSCRRLNMTNHSLKMSQLVLLLAVSLVVSGLHLSHDVGKLPALGWNSWNAYGCDVNATKVIDAADYIVSKGLRDAGYSYVVIDDCWSDMAGRDPQTTQLVPNPVTFPEGMKAVADHVHSRDLKIGIYSSAGTKTCAGYPASLGNEDLDAATFAGWEMDYLKYDNCYAPSNWTDSCYSCDQDSYYNPDLINGTCINNNGLCPDGYDFSQCLTAQRYSRMRDALLVQNRTMMYSLCEWGINEVWTWGAEMGSSWRTTNDVSGGFARDMAMLLQTD